MPTTAKEGSGLRQDGKPDLLTSNNERPLGTVAAVERNTEPVFPRELHVRTVKDPAEPHRRQHRDLRPTAAKRTGRRATGPTHPFPPAAHRNPTRRSPSTIRGTRTE